ncbi:SDR family oxidoreductase [Rhodopirellula sp. MGV]|uniref:SDR family oxidoreductase n=1 Tax=Rhodopirellula sp. MGV TaxID=2023130 RepID=UPI000B96D423|nr:SDR family oxidoreductase [Rhodopirellula sp. MGV]OYP35020.1 short-chain dehydrogenase [Rhodopirellula sp. MGV]PNY38079.1 KR domain-containing protein [Rhodopirellula baltica]
MTFLVKDSIALVTGANRGIGKAILEGLLQHGAKKVYAAVRDPQSVQPLIETYGDQVVAIELDLGKPETIAAAAKTASDVTLVVNNAGVLRTAPAMDSSAVEALQFEMDINVYGLIRIAQAFAPVLKSNGKGALVQLNSVASLKNFAEFATYSASKAASYSITQGLRAQLEPQDIQVVSVHPGPIATDMASAAGLSEIAEPPSLVATAIIEALESGDFHAFPDSMAKDFGEAYASFAENVIDSNEMAE